jgi:hypothetical protein
MAADEITLSAGFASPQQARRMHWLYRVHISLGLLPRVGLFSTPPRGDAVTLRFTSGTRFGGGQIFTDWIVCSHDHTEEYPEGIAIRANEFSAKRAQEGEGAELLNSLLKTLESKKEIQANSGSGPRCSHKQNDLEQNRTALLSTAIKINPLIGRLSKPKRSQRTPTKRPKTLCGLRELSGY